MLQNNDHNIYDNGFNKLLSKEASSIGGENFLGLPSSMKSGFYEVSPTTLASGELISALRLVAKGSIQGGQTDYNTGTGFFIGYSDGSYKFSMGDGGVSKYLTYDGVDLSLVGGKITGGRFQTAETGARIYMTGWSDTGAIQLYNSDGKGAYIYLFGASNYPPNALMLEPRGGDVCVGGGDFRIPNDIIPLWEDHSDIGDTTNYMRDIYAHTYYGKTTTIQSFQTENDIQMIKDIPVKKAKIEIKDKKEKKTLKDFNTTLATKSQGTEKKFREVEYFDISGISHIKEENGFYNVGAMHGLLIGAIKQLIEKVEKLKKEVDMYKNKVKQLESK